jgi:hypothetical protein
MLRTQLAARAVALTIVLGLVFSFGCLGETRCKNSGKVCGQSGTLEICEVKDANDLCEELYFVAPDGTRFDCAGCNCEQAEVRHVLYCAGVKDPTAVSDRACTKTSLGKPCTTGAECCSGACGLNAAGSTVCITSGGCKLAGKDCLTARDCCSTACVAGQCSDTAGLCKVQGEVCGNPTECCSNDCKTGTCQPLGGCHSGGDTCKTDDECCTKTCRTASDGKMRCVFGAYCRAEGEVCSAELILPGESLADECCTGPCAFENDVSTGTRRCRGSGICNAVGEPCTGPAECCSNACADDGTGLKTCRPLSGCRPDRERCEKDSDCCSTACRPTPGEAIKRCEVPRGCTVTGEICDPTFHECCPGGAVGQAVCSPALSGVGRCFDSSAQCIRDGAPCSIGEECCGKKCVAQAGGRLSCSSACVANEVACTTDSDCCSGNCDLIAITCKPALTSCIPLGSACGKAGDAGRCCSGTCGAGFCQTVAR